MKTLAQTTLSVLDLSLILKGGTAAEAFKRTLSLAQHVEKKGFHRFWLAEHHNMDGIASSATSVLIGYVAGGTSTIRVGSGGVMLPNHAPLVIAEQFGTLESMYPGRIDLGLGRAPGSDGLTMRALRRDLSGRGDDFAEMLNELLFFLAPVQEGQRVRAVPGAGLNIPIWILGSSLYSARLAAAMGRPYAFAGHFAPEMMLKAFEIYRSEFQPSEHLAKPYVMAGIPVIASDTDQRAEILATSSRRRFLNLIRGQSLLLEPPLESTELDWSPAERDMIESKFALAVVGGPERVKQGLQHIIDITQADELMINSDIYHHEERLRSYEIVAGLKSDAEMKESLGQ